MSSSNFPMAKYVVSHKGRLYLLGLKGSPNTFQWASLIDSTGADVEPDNYLAWVQAYGLSGQKTLEDSGGITGGYSFKNDFLVVFQRHAVSCWYGEAPENFTYKKLRLESGKEVGCIGQHTIQMHNGMIIWAGEDSIYGLNENGLQDLGINRIENYYKEFYKPEAKEYMLDTPFTNWSMNNCMELTSAAATLFGDANEVGSLAIINPKNNGFTAIGQSAHTPAQVATAVMDNDTATMYYFNDNSGASTSYAGFKHATAHTYDHVVIRYNRLIPTITFDLQKCTAYSLSAEGTWVTIATNIFPAVDGWIKIDFTEVECYGLRVIQVENSASDTLSIQEIGFSEGAAYTPSIYIGDRTEFGVFEADACATSSTEQKVLYYIRAGDSEYNMQNAVAGHSVDWTNIKVGETLNNTVSDTTYKWIQFKVLLKRDINTNYGRWNNIDDEWLCVRPHLHFIKPVWSNGGYFYDRLYSMVHENKYWLSGRREGQTSRSIIVLDRFNNWTNINSVPYGIMTLFDEPNKATPYAGADNGSTVIGKSYLHRIDYGTLYGSSAITGYYITPQLTFETPIQTKELKSMRLGVIGSGTVTISYSLDYKDFVTLNTVTGAGTSTPLTKELWFPSSLQCKQLRLKITWSEYSTLEISYIEVMAWIKSLRP